MRTTHEFTFFFGKQDPFSNRHPATFEHNHVIFDCVEQFMMYRKAILFRDYEVAERILETRDPQKQKELGRAVRNYVEEVWVEQRLPIVIDGGREKYAQNPDLLEALRSTGSTRMVEASPYDRIWGIGLGENDPKATRPELWRGLNLLGLAHDTVKDLLLPKPRRVVVF